MTGIRQGRKGSGRRAGGEKGICSSVFATRRSSRSIRSFTAYPRNNTSFRTPVAQILKCVACGELTR